MKGQLRRWVAIGCGLALVIVTAVACSSVEDRIENVVTHELEECKQTDDLFHTVRTREGSSFEILAELCHLEPSEVEMTNEWRGTIRTGPLVWLAEEDEGERAVLLRRVAWDELDRAQSYADRDNPSVEDLEAGEEAFATAQEQYGESGWLRLQRLNNLLRLSAEDMSTESDSTLVGSDAEAYLEELVEWADGQDGEGETVAKARLAVIDHVDGYIASQQRSIDTLGSRDDRLEAAADHAEDEGDMESARDYRAELEERREERPEVRERLEERIKLARHEACGYVDDLNVDNVSDDDLRTRVSSTMRNYDCEFDAEEDSDDDESNAD